MSEGKAKAIQTHNPVFRVVRSVYSTSLNKPLGKMSGHSASLAKPLAAKGVSKSVRSITLSKGAVLHARSAASLYTYSHLYTHAHTIGLVKWNPKAHAEIQNAHKFAKTIRDTLRGKGAVSRVNMSINIKKATETSSAAKNIRDAIKTEPEADKVKKHISGNFDDRINDKAVKRLLRLKELSPLQAGRILFLNNCYIIEGEKQLFGVDEYQALLKRMITDDEKSKEFMFYQRLATFGINELNLIKVKNGLALTSFDLISAQLEILKNHPERYNPETTTDAIQNIRATIREIHSYALYYDAAKKIFKDRRLKDEYRTTSQSKRVIQKAKQFDEFLESSDVDKYLHIDTASLDSYNAKMKRREKCHVLGLYQIGQIPRVYIEHKAKPQTIQSIIDYLKVTLDPRYSADNITTAMIPAFIESHFPRD